MNSHNTLVWPVSILYGIDINNWRSYPCHGVHVEVTWQDLLSTLGAVHFTFPDSISYGFPTHWARPVQPASLACVCFSLAGIQMCSTTPSFLYGFWWRVLLPSRLQSNAPNLRSSSYYLLNKIAKTHSRYCRSEKSRVRVEILMSII